MKRIIFGLLLLISINSFSQVPNYVPTNGLVGWWPFNGNANDESGNGNNGTVSGATLTTDRIGNPNKAYSFNATNSKIVIPSSPSQNFASEFTISLWAKYDSTMDQSLFIRQGTGGNYDRIWLLVTRGNPNYLRVYNENSYYGTFQNMIRFNTWYNIIAVLKDSTISVYNNGVLKSQTKLNHALSCSQTSMILGNASISGFGTTSFNGQLDEIGIWNRALTQSEITAVYNQQPNPVLPTYIPSNGLVGYWPFNGNGNDISGNGNNGTVSGAVLTKNRFGINNQAYFFSSSITSNIILPHSTQENVFSVMAWVKPLRTIDMKSVSSVCPTGVSVTMANSNQNWLVVPNQQTNPNIGSGGLSVGTNGVMSSEHGINILVPRHSYSNIDTNFRCVVLVYRLDSTFLYVNGTKVDSRPIHCNGALKKMAGPSYLGGTLYSPKFHGIIDDFGIWNRALTQNEIRNIALGNSQNIYTPTLIAQDTIKACGDSTLITAASGMNSYSWNNGKITSSIFVKSTGWYKVNVTSPTQPSNVLYDSVFVSILKAKIIQNDTSICLGQTINLNVEQNLSNSNYPIGSIGPAGGYVFYDKGSISNGWRYLEVAPSDISIGATWGCAGTTVAGIGTALGTGQSNTNLIIASCATSGIAAKLCEQAVINGFSDWYLPSKDEFNLIYQNIHTKGLGNFTSNTGTNSSVMTYNRYWTSSQVSPYGWAQDFTPYYQQIQSKSESSRVRPIRAFVNNIKYLWSTGDTTATIAVSPTQSTKYWVKVSNGISTCTDTISINVANNQPYFILPDTIKTDTSIIYTIKEDELFSLSLKTFHKDASPAYIVCMPDPNNGGVNSEFSYSSNVNLINSTANFMWKPKCNSNRINTYNFKFIVYAIDCNKSDSVTYEIKLKVIKAIESFPIIGNKQIVDTSITYKYTTKKQVGLYYNWFGKNASIITGQGTDSVNVKWNDFNGELQYVLSSNQTTCIDSSKIVVNYTTSINIDNNIKPKIYPNPTNDIINIEGLTPNENTQINIYDIQGKLILTKELMEEGTIDLSELNNGVYVVKIGEMVQRIVKM